MLLLVLTLGALPFMNSKAEAASKKPKLAETKKTLYIKSKYKTTYNIEIKNLTSKATVTYKSSKKSVATVSKKGVVTPVKAGSATITATVKQNSKTYTLKLKVTVKAATLTLTGEDLSKNSKSKPLKLYPGQSYDLGLVLSGAENISVYTSNNTKGYNLKAKVMNASKSKTYATYKSADKNEYLKISADGIVTTGSKQGNFCIVFTSYPSGLTKTVYIKVDEAAITLYTPGDNDEDDDPLADIDYDWEMQPLPPGYKFYE